MTIRRILVGLDGSPLAEAILAPVGTLAGRLGAEIVLLHVVVVPEAVSAAAAKAETGLDDVVTQERTRAQRYLESRAEELRKRGASIEVRVAEGMAADAITAEIHTRPGSLLVLSTHGRTGWRAVAFGSVARRVALLAAAPVLIVRPGIDASLESTR